MANNKWTRNQKLTFWGIVLSLALSLFSSSVSVINMVQQNTIVRKLNRLDIEPVVDCSLYQDEKDSYFLIKNNSPIKVVSLSVDYITYGYSKEQNEYRMAVAGGAYLEPMGKNWIFKKALESNEKIIEAVSELGFGEIQPKDIINVRVFDVVYYRESDMKKYSKRAIFFIDGKQFYAYSEALKIDSLQKPIDKLEEVIKSGNLYRGLNIINEHNLKKAE